jgi:hypothetical protein
VGTSEAERSSVPSTLQMIMASKSYTFYIFFILNYLSNIAKSSLCVLILFGLG